MRLRLGGSTLLLAAALAGIPAGCAKPLGPPNKSPEELKANEIRALERMRDQDVVQAQKEGKSEEQIEALKRKYQDSIDALKNPPPPPSDDVPPAEPKKDS